MGGSGGWVELKLSPQKHTSGQVSMGPYKLSINSDTLIEFSGSWNNMAKETVVLMQMPDTLLVESSWVKEVHIIIREVTVFVL